jgi:hypothetical protein
MELLDPRDSITEVVKEDKICDAIKIESARSFCDLIPITIHVN